MIYNLAAIKSGILGHEDYRKLPYFKQKVKDILKIETIFESGLIDKFYFYKNTGHISLNSLEKILEKIRIETGLNFPISLLNRYSTLDYQESESFNIENFESFKNIASTFHINKKADNQLKKDFKSMFETILPTDFYNKKLMAVDFEYIQTPESIEILEMGISISFNNEETYFHYVSENKQHSKFFNFGTSIVINKNEFLNIFESHLNNVDYLIGHALSMEYKVLSFNNFDCSKIDNIPFLDTSVIIMNEFNLDTEISYTNGNSISLKNGLHYFGIKNEHLHNAGNDSAYTLKLLKTLVKQKIKHFLSKSSKKRIKVKCKNIDS